MLKESAKISSLYSAPYMTIASDYLSRFEYPWEALSGIKDFIIEQRRDIEAMDAYMEVLDHVLFDYRLPMRVRRQLYSHAARGLISLCGSPEEVVWEICSQMREGLENYAV